MHCQSRPEYCLIIIVYDRRGIFKYSARVVASTSHMLVLIYNYSTMYTCNINRINHMFRVHITFKCVDMHKLLDWSNAAETPRSIIYFALTSRLQRHSNHHNKPSPATSG